MPASLLPTLLACLAQASFTDQTATAGLNFTHAQDTANFGNPMVAGGAVADFDRDGSPDVFLLGGGGRADALFLNDGAGQFSDQAAAWGVDAWHHGAGASAADFDGDGWTDLFVTSHGPAGGAPGPGHHRLYRNDAGAGFTDVAVAAGVNWTGQGAPDGYSSAWGDYDRDGDLDLYVAGWELNNRGNTLFRNEGAGSFTDVSLAAGVRAQTAKGFVPGFADMDGDLWPELILISDVGTSKYFINDRDGTFTALSPEPDGFQNLNGMGLAIGDLDGDGLLDFYGTSIWFGTAGTGNALWWNLGGHQYLEGGFAAGVADGAWGWGTTLLDCELDGRLDIAETNGWNGPSWENQPCRLFVNQGGHLFAEQAAAAGITQDGQGRTLLRLDAERDGDEDLIVLSNKEPLFYYRNEAAGGANDALRVLLDASAHPGLPPGGLGARAWADDGARTVLRALDAVPSYLGTSEHALHFGLGARSAVEEVRVQWPDGSWSARGPAAAGSELTIASGTPLAWAGTLARGSSAALHADGALPGEFVVFVHSWRGVGVGPATAALGGLRWDLRAPVAWLGAANADAAGRATILVAVPADAPLREVGVQAVIPRGLNGADSVKSNAVVAPIGP
jgi:hypothetical protein